MLDVKPIAYIVPLAEQVLDDITPVIQVRSAGDEDAVVTGLIRIYRQSTDQLLFTSELATTIVTHGATVNIAALSAWAPPAPADDDYFICADILATSYLPGPPQRAALGAWHFDIKPGPMGPAPAAHHTTHEDGGMDELDVTGLSGLLDDPQTPANHAPSHQNGGGDELNVGGLHGVLADDQPALAHDIADPTKHTSAATPGQLLQADAKGLPVDATNTDAAVAAAVAASHAQNTDTGLDAVFEATLEHVANKGVAGGYCGLPNPLDSTLPLRADGTPARPVGIFCEMDCLTYYAAGIIDPWVVSAISGGLISTYDGTPNHPGQYQLLAGGGANSGSRIRTDANSILISGGESADFIIRPGILSGTTIRAGFLDTFTSADATDGCYIEMAQVGGVNGVIVGKTASNSVRSTTATNLTLVTNTWYRLRVAVNAAANLVTFTCFSEAGAVLWTDTLAANIPTAAGRETGHGIVATNSAGGYNEELTLDYMSLTIARALVR
jgi:hypothetical protein